MVEWSLLPKGGKRETLSIKLLLLLLSTKSSKDGLSEFLPLVELFT